MVDTDQEQSLAYLFDPAFEFTNTAGKPLSGGYIELYVHGTRNKYYACSDWDGTLHPFQIPLDSLGANIVLVSPEFTYDGYIYNKFGNLVMSRYNMSPVGVGDVSVSGINSIVSDDGTVTVNQYGNTFSLSIADTVSAVSSLQDAVSGLIDDVQTVSSALDSVSGMLDGKKDVQLPYIASGTNVQTITKITQDEQGVMTVEYSDIQAQNPLTPGQYVNIDDDVISVTGLQPEGDYLEQADLDSYATKDYVTAYVEEHAGDDQVQSDWTQTDPEAVDYIKHKPDEKVLVAGDHIDITSTVSSVEISAEGFATEDYVVDYVDSVVSGLDPVDIISSDGTLAVSSTVSGSVKVFDLSVSGGQPVYFRGGETWVPVSGTTADFSRVKKFDGTIVPSDIVSGTVPLAEGLWAWDAIVDIYVGGHVNELVKCGIKGQAVGDGYDPDSETELLIDSTRPGVINSFTLTGLSRGGPNTRLVFTFTRENSSTSTMWVRMRRLSVYQVKGPGVSQSGGGGNYEAGYGIIINNNVISVNSDLIPDIDTVTNMIGASIDGLATEDYVTGYVESQVSGVGNGVFIATYGTTTYNEILTAATQGKFVFMSTNNNIYYAPLMQLYNNTKSNVYNAVFYMLEKYSQVPEGYVYKVNGNNEWSSEPLWTHNASYQGKFLKYSDGVPYWAETPKELPTYTYATAGKVLSVNNYGQVAWTLPVTGVTEEFVTGYVESQVSGLQPAGNYLVPSDLEGYSTEDYVTAYVDSHVTGADIFTATYGTTTFNEITQALEAGKTVFMKRNIGITYVEWNVLPMTAYFRSNDPYDSYAKFAYVTTGNVITGAEFKVDGNNSWTATGLWNIGAGNVNQYLGVIGNGRSYYLAWKNLPSSPTYTAGNYIDITSDVISVTGLQPAGDYLVSGDLEGYATSDEVNTVSGAIVSLIPTVEITPTVVSGTKIAEYSIDGVSGELFAPIASGGGSSTVYVDTHTGLKGDGSQGDPLAINYDTNTLSTTQGTDTVTFTSGAGGYAVIPGNSAMATYMSSHTVSITFQGITPVSQYRYPVKLTLSPADGQGGDIYINTYASIAANDTTCVYMFDIRYDVAAWSTGTWDPTKDWNLWLYLDDGATYAEITYGYATSVVPSDNYKLTVKEPIPSHGYADGNKVLTVNSSNNTLIWNTARYVPYQGFNDANKVLKVSSDALSFGWEDLEVSVVSGSPIAGKGNANDPLDLNIDTDTLTVNTVSDSDLPMVDGYAIIEADSDLAKYMRTGSTYHTVTFTITGITPVGVARDVYMDLQRTSGSYYVGISGSWTLPANATSLSMAVNVSNYSEWSSGPFTNNYSWKISTTWDDDGSYPQLTYTACSHNGPAESLNKLTVKNPVPSSTSSDENKVLTVNSSGTPEWQVVASDPVSGGNCISVNSDVVSWMTTAGITDIVSAATLPANPVSTVIYLIPET